MGLNILIYYKYGYQITEKNKLNIIYLLCRNISYRTQEVKYFYKL